MQLAKKRKKTPKNSNKKSKKQEKRENIIIWSIFLVFIVVVAYLFYFLNVSSPDEDVVAIVSGSEITRDELDWWYDISVLPVYRDFITKQDFLVVSLIPQEALMQKAKEEGIKVTDDDIEKLIGLFLIENGLTLDEFERDLESRGIGINDIKKSFQTKATITKLLEKENIDFMGEDDETAFFDANYNSFYEYLDNLINNSDIRIFPENIEKLVLRSFEITDDELCDEEKPVIRLYTTSFCEICEDSGKIFENLVEDLVKEGKIEAYHWSLDTGDDLLTSKKEKGVPKEEVALFKKYSPDNLVPAVIVGCKYKRIGKLGVEEEDEFKIILKTLII